MSPISGNALIGTGIAGLDEVLNGGLETGRIYLVEGDPGAGKTTLALQFLLEGARQGESVLHLTMAETRDELEAISRSHGWSLEGIEIQELSVSEEATAPEEQYTMFQPHEMELSSLIQQIKEAADRTGARRLVIDSLAELRLVAQNPLWYRRQLLALKQHFAGRNCTALLLDETAAETASFNIQTVPHGVLSMSQIWPDYGSSRRRLQVLKMRGRAYQSGYHDYAISAGGLQVFPRLVALEHRRSFQREKVESGLLELDALLGGGLERGTSTQFSGAAGTGKSALGTLYGLTAARRGEKAAFFLFEETRDNFITRARGLGMDVSSHLASGDISCRQVDPGELTPGEFSTTVRKAVEEDGARLVVIDSLNGYLQAVPEERFLIIHLHELLSYLAQMGVTTLLIVPQHGVTGTDTKVPIDISYLCDALILMRYFEARGEVRQAISVLKNRTGAHERTIREMRITPAGIRIGEPLSQFQGVLQGNPVYQGAVAPLLTEEHDK